MDEKVLAPIPLWATVVHGLTLTLSLLVIAMPEIRSLPVRALLTMLCIFILIRAVLRLKQANGLGTPMSRLSRHLPATRSFADSLALIAMTVGGLTQVLAF